MFSGSATFSSLALVSLYLRQSLDSVMNLLARAIVTSCPQSSCAGSTCSMPQCVTVSAIQHDAKGR